MNLTSKWNWILLNIHEKKAILNVYRVGYHPNDKPDMPFASFSIPKNLIHKDNMYGCHTITLSSDLGFTKFYIDNVERRLALSI